MQGHIGEPLQFGVRASQLPSAFLHLLLQSFIRFLERLVRVLDLFLILPPLDDENGNRPYCSQGDDVVVFIERLNNGRNEKKTMR